MNTSKNKKFMLRNRDVGRSVLCVYDCGIIEGILISLDHGSLCPAKVFFPLLGSIDTFELNRIVGCCDPVCLHRC